MTAAATTLEVAATFDALADQVAEAFRDGDLDAADRLYCELHARFLGPDLQRRLRFFAWQEERRDDVMSRVIEQVYERRFRAGKPVYHRYLGTIYRRCAYDERQYQARHSSRAAAHDDDVDFERLVQGSSPGAGADVDLRMDLLAVAGHFRGELQRPQWAAVLESMLEGNIRGADVASATGMTQVRVRQIKMEVGRYLRGPGRHLLGGE